MSMSTRRKSELREATPFTQLTFLLHLVTSINLNQNGISTFKRESNARASDQTLFTFLDSVTAILVQEHEVVAACHISNDVSVIAVNDPPPKIDDENPLPQNYDSDNPPTGIDVNVDVPSDIFPSFAAISTGNPHVSDKMEHNENVKVRTGGESLWKKVQGTKRGWYCAFM